VCSSDLARFAFVLISKLYRQMYANTGIATDSARVSRANRWARLIAKPCRRLFVARPLRGTLSDDPRPSPRRLRVSPGHDRVGEAVGTSDDGPNSRIHGPTAPPI